MIQVHEKLAVTDFVPLLSVAYLFNVAVMCVLRSIIIRGIHTDTVILIGTLFILGYRITCVTIYLVPLVC